MRDLYAKLRLIFLPFLLLLLTFPWLYAILLVALGYELRWAESTINGWMLWLPLVPGTLLVLLTLRPRLNLLRPQRRGDSSMFLGMMACASLVLPSISATDFIASRRGKLTALDSITQLPHRPPTDFYTVRDFYLGKRQAAFYPETQATGKNSQRLDVTLYASYPLFATAADTLEGRPVAWLGASISEVIDNRISHAQREGAQQQFMERAHRVLQQQRPEQFAYLQRVRNAGDAQPFRAAVAASPWGIIGTAVSVVLLPVNEPFAARGAAAWRLLWLSTAGAAALFLFLLLFPRLSTHRVADFLAGRPRPDYLRDWLAWATTRLHAR
ncbi:hypothetical protein [Hymenobacter sp. B81]|uniref:hypothetical protein n=1 Tax=Hymenobacter sp. B81 TaxID=3344878 RepID=UPI0037DCE0D5